MDRTILTTTKFVTEDEHTEISNRADKLEGQIHHVQDSIVSFTSDHFVLHETEKQELNNELEAIKTTIHNLKVSLMWAIAGLVCSGVGIFGLCIHLIS